MKGVLFSSVVIICFSLSAQNNRFSYDHIPDVTYEEMQDRLACIDSEIPRHFNEKVKGLIDYFTIGLTREG